MSILNYLKENNAQKQIDKLAKKYKNKEIVLYGAGEFFSILLENYDISKLNIIGIVDRKFENFDQKDFYGYKTLTPSDLKTVNYDIIITMLYDTAAISNLIEYKTLLSTKNEGKPVISIIEPDLKYIFKTFLNNTDERVIITKKIKDRYLNIKKIRYIKIYHEILESYYFMKNIIDFEHLKLENITKEECVEYFATSENWIHKNRPKFFIFNKLSKYSLLISKLKEMLKFLTNIADIKYLKPTQEKYLRDYQLKTLEYCKEITDFFDKNNLKYFLLGGTLIGALRHQGFVPWDDDIDVGMMREDYERLKKYLIENGVSVDTSKIFVSDANITKQVNKTLKKNHNKLVYMIGPKYIQIYRGTCVKDCVYIDIFPHEYYKDDYSIEEHQNYVRDMNSVYIKINNFKEIVKFFDNEIKTNKNVVAKSNTIYYGVDSFVNYTILHKKFMSEDMIFPLKKTKFEHYEFYIPNNAEEYISIEYPEFRNLPPEIEIAPDLKWHLNFKG